MAELEVGRFFKRIGKLHGHFVKHNQAVWGNADCLVLCRGPLNEEDLYLKSTVLHQWIFGYELPDTIILLKKDGNMWVAGSKKKCDFIGAAANDIPSESPIKKINLLVSTKKGDEDSNKEVFDTLWNESMSSGSNTNATKTLIGIVIKEREMNAAGGIVGTWESKVKSGEESDKRSFDLVDVTAGISFAMSIKDESELDLIKKSSVLANKVMKHGYVKRMEEVIDSEETVKHEDLATIVEEILEDPSKISLRVPKDDVQSCYFPIVQSGGKYDLKVSAQSSSDKLSHDVIVVSLGARYKLYCSNITRTFLVDPPKKVSETYDILLEMQEVCLRAMKPGNQLKAVYRAATDFLQQSAPHLIEHLPKNLGFGMGLVFREPTMLLTSKNTIAFKNGMVFCLSVGFQNLILSESDRNATNSKSPVKKLSTYGLLLADTVAITNGVVEVMTKMGKDLTSIAYNISDDAADDDDDNSDTRGGDVPEGDEEYARKLASERGGATRTSKRLAKDAAAQADVVEGVAERERRQIDLMKRRNEDRIRELARSKRLKNGDDDKDQVEELQTYRRTRDYPENTQPNQVKVDMANQCVLLPICGNPVPFHISTIKNVVMPDADNATLLRINFYTAGMAVGKEAPANMAKLVAKYAPYASFIRELTFRSLDGHNLTLAYRQISELRKRARQRELHEQEEATLVQQEKLVRTKNERVPRLADLTMRPVVANRKTQGNLEAHSNGLRFISTKSEIVDVMYANIKYAIFQPCQNEIMVLIHFHLKNPIMIGKKKHSDVQFFTEVVDASQAVDDSRRSMYDPDEMDDEHRERQLRKKLNQAFKEFKKKVEMVARKSGYDLEFDEPYRDLGFTGNPHKEMVTIMPTLNCIVNLTETPFFVVDLDEVDHVHFERVTYMSKAFDIVLVNKDFMKQPWRIDMIPNGDKDSVQEWLTDMEITYTEGPMNLNWKQIIGTVKEDDRFYMDTEDDEVTPKEAGWQFLRLFGNDDDTDMDEDADDSEFSDDKDVEEEASDDDSEVEDMESEEDESEFDESAEDDLEEQGLDWDEMEAEAAIDDKKKRRRDVDEVVEESRKPRRSDDRCSGGEKSRRSNGDRGGGDRKRSNGADKGRNGSNRGRRR